MVTALDTPRLRLCFACWGRGVVGGVVLPGSGGLLAGTSVLRVVEHEGSVCFGWLSRGVVGGEEWVVPNGAEIVVPPF